MYTVMDTCSCTKGYAKAILYNYYIIYLVQNLLQRIYMSTYMAGKKLGHITYQSVSMVISE